MSNDELRDAILGRAEDTMSNFLYYDRKGDDLIKVDMIEEAIANGVVTVDEILEVFRTQLTQDNT